jgi:hypothetical protein
VKRTAGQPFGDVLGAAGSGRGGVWGISEAMVLDGRTREAAASKARVSRGVLPSVCDRRLGLAEAGRAGASIFGSAGASLFEEGLAPE